MKRKIKSAKGFTLAELLIVVAIIAVLVAIGIPIFTSQLEKSREAVDLSDVRSAYAEVMMASITGDTTAYYTKDTNQTIYDLQNNVYTITVEPLKQKQDNWQTALPITIGGVSSTDNVHWVGNPGANGKCRIVYTPAQGATGDYVTFYWEGGTSGDSGTGGNDNNNPDVTPDPGKDNEPSPTQTPTPSGNISAGDYPPKPEMGKEDYIYKGWVYKYSDGKTYVVTNTTKLTNGWYVYPGMKDTEYLYAEITGRTLTAADDKVSIENGEEKRRLGPIKRGDLYYDGKDYYVRLVDAEDGKSEPPTVNYNEGAAQWLLIRNFGS